MRTLTVFLAPDGPAAGVPDVLTDLSAAGLVTDFLWVVDADMALDGYGDDARDVPAVRVAAGRPTATTIRSELAGVPHDRRRLCVVVPVSDGTVVPSAAEQRLSDIVSFAGDTVPTARIRVIVARPGDHTSPEVLSRNGWHNVYLAPEDALGPGRPPRLVAHDADPVELGRHAAPAIAGLVGLWTGVDDTPLDDAHTPAGVRAGRVFYRRIDARLVEAELRDRVLSTRAPLPEPSGQAANAVYATNPAGACAAMVGQWWQRHEKTLIGQRRRPEVLPPVPTGLRAMLALFFRFLRAALRRAPFELFDGAAIAAKAAAARRVNNLVLGAGPSSLEVVVKGVDGDGKPLSWRQIGGEIGRIDGQLAAGGVTGVSAQQLERPDLRQMWADYADGAMTLVDGGKRALAPVSHDGQVHVLRSTVDAAPPPDADFDVPGRFHGEVDAQRVQVGDVLGAEVLHRRLEHLVATDSRARDADSTQQDLAAWQERYRQTYSAQVGGLLGHHLSAMTAEIQARLRSLQDMANTLGPGVGRPSRRRVWLIWLLLVVALAAPVAAYALWTTDTVSGRLALAIGTVPAVAWLIGVVTAFVKEKGELFRDLNRRRELMSKVDAERANLRQATIDAGRLAQAYEQYLVWSRVVGALLHRPFGPPGAGGSTEADITYGLPLATRVARGEVDDDAVGNAAAVLRNELFRIGWLGPAWAGHLAGAGAQIGSFPLRNNPKALLDLRGGVADSDLERWSDVLADPKAGPAAGPGDAAWAHVQGLLLSRHRERADGLFSSVREIGSGPQQTVNLETFLCGVHHPWDPARGQEFAATHFTSAGRSAMRGRVAVHECRHAPLGLSRVDVLVQLTEAAEPWSFAVVERPPLPGDGGGGAPPPFPPSGSTAAYRPREEQAGVPAPAAPEGPSGFR